MTTKKFAGWTIIGAAVSLMVIYPAVREFGLFRGLALVIGVAVVCALIALAAHWIVE